MTGRSRALIAQALQLSSAERADVAAALVGELDAAGLARVPVPWFAGVTALAKRDPRAAGGLAAALYGHLAAHRPESPAPLDDGFAPTEPVPTSAPAAVAKVVR